MDNTELWTTGVAESISDREQASQPASPHAMYAFTLESQCIASFRIKDDIWLCYPQILKKVLKGLSPAAVYSACEMLPGIAFWKCDGIQEKCLIDAEVIDKEEVPCTLVNRIGALQLCDFFFETDTCEVTSSFKKIPVYHECFGGLIGLYIPALDEQSRSKCFQCGKCHHFFSAPQFICHSPCNKVDTAYNLNLQKCGDYIIVSEVNETISTTYFRDRDRLYLDSKSDTLSLENLPLYGSCHLSTPVASSSTGNSKQRLISNPFTDLSSHVLESSVSLPYDPPITNPSTVTLNVNNTDSSLISNGSHMSPVFPSTTVDMCQSNEFSISCTATVNISTVMNIPESSTAFSSPITDVHTSILNSARTSVSSTASADLINASTKELNAVIASEMNSTQCAISIPFTVFSSSSNIFLDSRSDFLATSTMVPYVDNYSDQTSKMIISAETTVTYTTLYNPFSQRPTAFTASYNVPGSSQSISVGQRNSITNYDIHMTKSSTYLLTSSKSLSSSTMDFSRVNTVPVTDVAVMPEVSTTLSSVSVTFSHFSSLVRRTPVTSPFSLSNSPPKLSRSSYDLLNAHASTLRRVAHNTRKLTTLTSPISNSFSDLSNPVLESSPYLSYDLPRIDSSTATSNAYNTDSTLDSNGRQISTVFPSTNLETSQIVPSFYTTYMYPTPNNLLVAPPLVQYVPLMLPMSPQSLYLSNLNYGTTNILTTLSIPITYFLYVSPSLSIPSTSFPCMPTGNSNFFTSLSDQCTEKQISPTTCAILSDLHQDLNTYSSLSVLSSISQNTFNIIPSTISVLNIPTEFSNASSTWPNTFTGEQMQTLPNVDTVYPIITTIVSNTASTSPILFTDSPNAHNYLRSSCTDSSSHLTLSKKKPGTHTEVTSSYVGYNLATHQSIIEAPNSSLRYNQQPTLAVCNSTSDTISDLTFQAQNATSVSSKNTSEFEKNPNIGRPRPQSRNSAKKIKTSNVTDKKIEFSFSGTSQNDTSSEED